MLGFGIFLFHSLGQPLFDHGLIVEVSASREAFEATEHPRIHSEGNRCRLLTLGSRERRGEESWVKLMVGPVVSFLFWVGKEGDFLPLANLIEIAQRDSLALRS